MKELKKLRALRKYWTKIRNKNYIIYAVNLKVDAKSRDLCEFKDGFVIVKRGRKRRL